MKKIFVLTGEPSGDKLASTVISRLKLKNPLTTFVLPFVYLPKKGVSKYAVRTISLTLP